MPLNSDADLKKAIAWAKEQEPGVIDWDKFGNRFPELDTEKMKKFEEPSRFPLLTPMIAEHLEPEHVPYGAPLGEQAPKIGLNILKDIGAFSTWPIAALETLFHPEARPAPEEVPWGLEETPLERPAAVGKGLLYEFPKAVGRSWLDIATGIGLYPQAQMGKLSPAEEKRYRASLERLAEHPLVPIAGALGMKGLAAAGKRFVEPTARYKAAVKIAERPEMTDIETYYKSITQPPRPEHPMGLGVARVKKPVGTDVAVRYERTSKFGLPSIEDYLESSTVHSRGKDAARILLRSPNSRASATEFLKMVREKKSSRDVFAKKAFDAFTEKPSDPLDLLNDAVEVSSVIARKDFRGKPQPTPRVAPEVDRAAVRGGPVIYPQKLGVAEAQARGIALRTTKGGKVVPAVREAGTFVPEDFMTYPNFKDARQGMGGGTKDPIRFIQEIDGALSVQQKAKLPGQAGPAERGILRRTEDMVRLKVEWSGEQMIRGKKIAEGISRKQDELATRVLEETSREGAFVETADFAMNPRVRAITTDPKVIKFAQESRKLLEDWIAAQNRMRVLRNQPEIPYRQFYAPHTLKKATLWSRRFGLKQDPIQFIEQPRLPDYIKPDKPFNPRELAREAEMPNYLREMRLTRLLEDYANTAARDIFHTSIIQNGKAFVQGLEARGLNNAARGVGNWMAEGFGGIRGAGDRFLDAPRWLRKSMRIWRTGLIRSVFPLNWTWNTIVQTSSGVLTVARAGASNSFRGAVDWFGSKKLRGQIVDNAYSAMIKAQKAGRITEQDINIGMTKAVKLRKTKFDTAVDAANYLTEFVERHLTGWSIASGLRQGAQQGMRGRALWDYASDMGAKTQSMYNLENLPGMLRSEVVKTAAPFQTFSFELFNNMREFLGKTGTPPGTAGQRIGWALRFIGGVIAVQQIGRATTGRKPYDVYSFFPFSDTWLKPIVNALTGKGYETARGRGLPSPVGSGVEAGLALRTLLRTGNWRKMRNWAIKYVPGLAGIPGGTQASRMVDGIIAVADGGLEDSSDRMLFPITETKEQIRAITMGPWRTQLGREYWEKREKPITEMFKKEKKKPKRSFR